jgi:hypothetical protein
LDVPDRRAAAILADGAFDLIGCGGAPEKFRGKDALGRATVRPIAKRASIERLIAYPTTRRDQASRMAAR